MWLFADADSAESRGRQGVVVYTLNLNTYGAEAGQPDLRRDFQTSQGCTVRWGLTFPVAVIK